MSHTQPPLPPPSAQEDLVRLLVPDAAGAAAPHGVMMNGVSAGAAGGTPSVAFGHAAANAANPNPPRRNTKRRGSDGQRIVTGRSFKRLRIDHVHFFNGNATTAGGGGAGFPSTHSTGTLSVGTMGGDLESNDEDLGDEDDDDETEDGAHTHPGESVASSWVASLGGSHGGFRKRRLPGMGATFGEGAVDTFQPLPGARTFQPLHADEDEDDDDADARTCSAMTTAAVAPRRRRPRHNGKRKAIGFMIDAPASIHPHAMPGKHDELDLEAVEMDATLGSSGKRSDNSSRKTLPPIDQIPDPLLVAAQHAAGGDATGTMPQQGPSVAFDTAALAAPADAAHAKVGGTVLVMGDCCSSVTEEDGSLAEDEASISAISIGANTTVSALSGGMEGSLPPSGMPGSFEHIERQRSMQSMRQTNPSPAPGGAAKGHSPSEYAPLNVILGGLHKERLTRLSTNRSLSRGESSLHSMGSEGAHSGGDGGSYRSLPGNIHAAGVSVSWNAAMAAAHPPHAPPAMAQPPPPSFVQQQQQQQPPLAMDEDAEMEEADGGGKLGPAGSFQSGSVASHHGSHAGSFSSGAAVASCGSAGGERGGGAADPNLPKWKRRVNLPSHSSLY